MQKLKLDSHIKKLVTQAKRHQDYVTGGKEAEMLVDRAFQLKLNVQMGEKTPESLVTSQYGR